MGAIRKRLPVRCTGLAGYDVYINTIAVIYAASRMELTFDAQCAVSLRWTTAGIYGSADYAVLGFAGSGDGTCACRAVEYQNQYLYNSPGLSGDLDSFRSYARVPPWNAGNKISHRAGER